MLKQLLSLTLSVAALVSPFAFTALALAAAPSWNTTGNYVLAVKYLGTDYVSNLSLTQNNLGALTGTGAIQVGAQTYNWQVASGTVSGNTIAFTAQYTATSGSLVPSSTVFATGVIAASGTMSGTWSGNYQGVNITGPWMTTSGIASSTSGTSNGVLAVTSIEMTDTSASANGSFTDGWKYVFHITAPTNESNITMKFADWLQTSGSGVLPVGSHMRISSAQADNGGATILLTGANVYSAQPLHMTSDLESGIDGRQVVITVEVAVPTGTPRGSYTTTYGVQSNP